MISETIAQIEKRLLTVLKATPPYNSINLSPSAVALFSNFMNTVATEIYTLQQLDNTFETEIENDVKGVTSPTNAWWQKQILLFQYSATVAQVVQMDVVNFAPFYSLVSAALRIITNCSVNTLTNSIVQIKVTKSGAVLSGPEAIALESYVQTISPAGIEHAIINELPDYLFLNAEVFYNGQYASVIQANVIAALNNYLANIPFDGIVKVSALEDAIQSVAGVTDVTISEAAAMRYATYIASGYAARNIFTKQYQSYSGQIINGPAPKDFAGTLTFTIQNN